MIKLQPGSRIDLSQNLEAISERDYIVIKEKEIVNNGRSEEKLYFDSKINYCDKTIGCRVVELNEVQHSNKADHEFIDAANLVEPFILRKWRKSDRFKPLGLNGTKKVSDFLTELKVPNIGRKEQLVLLNNEKIVWVVDHRIDESVKISKKTKKVMKLWIK